ncbi:MAG: hypothetical protein GX439_04615 [Bacteroidales bacterium]|nr:hypothetical protein [Bacteroidales bacterium]
MDERIHKPLPSRVSKYFPLCAQDKPGKFRQLNALPPLSLKLGAMSQHKAVYNKLSGSR